MSSYPGNASLATAVKDRVVSTFEQTLALYRQGRQDEVVAGCNLILQMDPLFDPARRLLEKAQNPDLPIDVNRLMGGGDGMADARAAMDARDFERVIQLTTDILTNDLMNDEARVLSDQAREKMEAAPFVDQFVRKCQQHIASGNVAAAKADLEKARALDPNHPGIAEIERMITGAAPAAAAPSAPTAFDASSFVVDTPSTATRGTAQASDFGFTFEEDKNTPAGGGFDSFSFDTPAAPSGGFSFDSPITTPEATPPPPPPAKEGTEFDFSTASIETSPDDQKKIDQYLADGDRAFASGDYQQAIDFWSRIFLIDVTNDAASERIEKAKGKRREIEQRLESILAAGIQAFEKRDFDTAKARFQEVLQGEPGNVQAQDYLERMEAEASGATAFPPPPAPSFGDVLEEPVSGFDDEESLPESAAITPPPPSKKAASPRPAAAAPTKKKSPLLAIAAVVAVLLLGGAGWFLFSRGESAPDQTPAATAALVTRANSLGQQGRFDEAIAVLREIQPGDTQYDTAIAMIADLQQKQRRASTAVQGKPAAAFYEENIEAGRAAFAAHDYVGAKKAFDAAIRVQPLPPELKASYDTATQQVAKLESARQLFAERKYQDVITSLAPVRAQDPTNQNVRRMIIDAHFNMGALALQQDRIPQAIRAFDEVLREDPDDELARRSRELAQRYEGRPRDLLYRIYVKYLPLRQAAT